MVPLDYTGAYSRLTATQVLRTTLGLDVGYMGGSHDERVTIYHHQYMLPWAKYPWTIRRYASHVAAAPFDSTMERTLIPTLSIEVYHDFHGFVEASRAH